MSQRVGAYSSGLLWNVPALHSMTLELGEAFSTTHGGGYSTEGFRLRLLQRFVRQHDGDTIEGQGVPGRPEQAIARIYGEHLLCFFLG
jgi:hypothetical protein